MLKEEVKIGKHLFYVVENVIYEDIVTNKDNDSFYFNDYRVEVSSPDREYFESAEDANLSLLKVK